MSPRDIVRRATSRVQTNTPIEVEDWRVQDYEDDEVDPKRLNEAKWAALNMRWSDPVPSMEDVSEAVERAIKAYLSSGKN